MVDSVKGQVRPNPLLGRGPLVLLCVALLGNIGTSEAQDEGSAKYPLVLSPDARYVVDQLGEPFFINGDTAWSLVVGISKKDAELYLEDRRRRGFNLVLVNLIEHKFSSNPPKNFYGQEPFLIPGDFTTPSDAYFDHADWIIRKAEEKGITVLLAPLYLGYDCGDEGWCQDVLRSSADDMRTYGRYLGRRYAAVPNVIWLIGGDTDPFGDYSADGIRPRIREFMSRLRRAVTKERQWKVGDKLRAFVSGLRESDRVHLVSAHNRRGQAAVEPWLREPWLDLNNIYTRNREYLSARREFSRTPFKPFFLVEAYYENEHSSTPLSLRRQAYWAVLSGATLGHIFGNCQIWGFSHGFCTEPWKPQLNSTGSRTLPLVGRLFGSRSFHELTPEHHRVVTTHGEDQSGNAYVTSAVATDGSTMVAYIPSRQTVVTDLSGISDSSAKAWWFNPRTGAASLIGSYPTTDRLRALPPDRGDWVLVVDAASLDLAPPGQPTY